MGHRHVMLADFPGVADRKGFAQVQRQLMAEKIEIDPRLGTATFFTPQQTSIKIAGNLQIADVHSEMKNRLHIELLTITGRWKQRNA
jgi:hypothetical protein